MAYQSFKIDNFGQYPGYWTELMIIHDWPKDWKPSTDWGKDSGAHSEAAVRGRETQLANGQTGTIVGLSKAADDGSESYRAIMAAKGRR